MDSQGLIRNWQRNQLTKIWCYTLPSQWHFRPLFSTCSWRDRSQETDSRKGSPSGRTNLILPNSGERSKAASVIPNNNHQITTEINLTKCHSVAYEKVTSMEWYTIPVTTSKSGPRLWRREGNIMLCIGHRWGLTVPSSGPVNRVVIPATDDDSPVNPLCIPPHAQVEYVEISSTPGLQIGTRCTRNWTPIATRTRLQSKNKNLVN